MCYTADGECVLAGGRSKYVCIYAIESQLLLKRFQLSHNRSVAGTVDKLNTKFMTEAGDVGELDMSDSDEEKRWVAGEMQGATSAVLHAGLARMRVCVCVCVNAACPP